jgi:hypothetical protein
MKKQFLFAAVAILLITLGSCKKWYTCTCSYQNGGGVYWQGSVEGTSKTQVQNYVGGPNGDCAGYNVSCN